MMWVGLVQLVKRLKEQNLTSPWLFSPGHKEIPLTDLELQHGLFSESPVGSVFLENPDQYSH